jgi:hypothetical protein
VPLGLEVEALDLCTSPSLPLVILSVMTPVTVALFILAASDSDNRQETKRKERNISDRYVPAFSQYKQGTDREYISSIISLDEPWGVIRCLSFQICGVVSRRLGIPW